ncbi:hypothetical protein BAE44_0016883 [Dichanthelium oligosanthes]|uniref:BRCT domain-containing protein n=1 Tax=Dichanthelium oligosanthes TaxID=888268 RepID=A0A1E5VAC1_9POAL|nr:hypothetical protein BAE44_0016883 [Dichanthelium oligosanthes]
MSNAAARSTWGCWIDIHGPMVRYLKGKVASIDKCNSSNAIYVHEKCLYCSDNWLPLGCHVLCPEHVSKTLPDELSTHTKENGNSSSLRQSQCTDKKGKFDDHHRKNQQKDQLNTSNASSLPHSQQSDDGGISKDRERDDQRTHKCDTSNLSSLPQSCHPYEEGISNAYQEEAIKAYQHDTSSCPSDQLVLLGLSFSASEKDSLQEFARWTNATQAKEWAKNVTHVIVGKGAGSSWNRSFEVLMAILLGKWVVHFEWIADCSPEMPPRPEASYEVAFSMDSVRTIDGPKKGRIRANKGTPNLFSGLRFCLSAYMNPDNRRRLRGLTAAAEGRVLEGGDLERFLLKNPDGSSVRPYYFVYDDGAPREFALSTLRKEVEEARKHAAAGARVTCHSRVLDAIAAYDVEILDGKKDRSTS